MSCAWTSNCKQTVNYLHVGNRNILCIRCVKLSNDDMSLSYFLSSVHLKSILVPSS